MTGRLKRSVENFYGDYNYPTDQKTTKAMLKLYRTDIDPKYWPSFYKLIDTKFKGNIDAFVDNIFAKSIFVSQEKLAAFLEAPSLKVLQKDPAFIVAKSINEMNSTLMKDLQDSVLTSQRGSVSTWPE